MVGVSTSLGAQIALQSTNRSGAEAADVARSPASTKNDTGQESARADAPSAAFLLSENAQGVILSGSEGARTEKDSARRQLVDQMVTELVKFFTDLYAGDFGYSEPDAAQKARRVVTQTQSALDDKAYQIGERVSRSDVNPDQLAYMIHVEVMKLQGDAPPPPPDGAEANPDDARSFSQLRDVKVALTLEARHQSGVPSFTEPVTINLRDERSPYAHEPLIDLNPNAWANRLSSAQTDGTLTLTLNRTVPIAVTRADRSAPREDAPQGERSPLNVVA